MLPENPSSENTHSTNSKVPVSSKIIYGLGTANDMWGNWLYNSIVWTVFNMYLGLPGKLISTALALRLIWDAVTDPLFGWWSDNTRTRFGRRRPFILVGSILAGITIPFLFAIGEDWSNGQYFAWMLVSSMVFMTFVSCFNMPYQSLGAELTPDYRERTSIFSFKGSIQKIMEIGMFSAGAFATALVWENATWADVPAKVWQLFTNALAWTGQQLSALATFSFGEMLELMKTPFGMKSGAGNEDVDVILGAQVYMVLIGALMILIGFILFFGLKERYYDSIVSKSQQRVKITETIWEALRCRPFRTQLAMGLAYALGLSMVGTLGYYTTIYYVSQGNLTEGNLWNAGMGLANTAFGFLGPIVFSQVAGKLDKKRTIFLIQFLAMIIFTATWWLYTPEKQWMQLFASGSIAFTQAAFWMMYGSIGADVIDYDELESGKRREGAFSACGTYIMKIGMVLGTLITGFALDWTGFDASLGGEQDPSAIFWIRFLLAAVPIAGLLFSFVLLIRFPLSAEKMADIRAQLEARRGTV